MIEYCSLPIDPQWCWQVSQSLIHTLWQGILIATVVAFLLRMRFDVHQKFRLTFASLLLVGILPIANYWWVSATQSPEPVLLAQLEFLETGQLTLFRLDELAEPERSVNRVLMSTPRTSGDNQVVLTAAPEVPPNASWFVLAPALITIAYAFGVTAMFIKLALGLRRQSRFLRFGRSIGTKTPNYILQLGQRAARSLGRELRVPIYLFAGKGGAFMIGVLRPAILINVTLVSGLTPSQLEQILAHELAHVYRWDAFTQLFQRLVESLLFYHPGVWYLSHQISELRELCCDDLASDQCERHEYAETLVQCAMLCTTSTFAQKRRSVSLAAMGSSSSQLASRIEVLLESQPTAQPKAPGTVSSSSNLRATALTIVFATASICLWTFYDGAPGSGETTAQQVGDSLDEESVKFKSSQWNWEKVDPAKLKQNQFLLGGKILKLSEKRPNDLKVNAMVTQENCRFAQWYFGDRASTRLALMAEMNGQKINGVFIDSNRNRIIEEGEKVRSRILDNKGWIHEVPVEVRNERKKLLSSRQLVITRRRHSDELRVSTVGFAAGDIKFNGKKIAVRRFDRDGNGLPIDSADSICFDFNGDGLFDQISECFNMKPAFDFDGKRYIVRSDRLGQSVQLSRSDEQGKIKFVYQPKEPGAKVLQLEGALRDTDGLFIPLRLNESAITVPAGRYCIENLVVEIADKNDTRWRMTLSRGFDVGWFEVQKDETHELKLLERFLFTAIHVEASRLAESTDMLRPSMYSENGLVVTNLTRVKAGEDPIEVTSGATQIGQPEAKFEIKNMNQQSQKPVEHCSGFN